MGVKEPSANQVLSELGIKRTLKTLSTLRDMEREYGNRHWENVVDLYGQISEQISPNSPPQACLDYYVCSLFEMARYEMVAELDENKLEYDKTSTLDVDAYVACAKANIQVGRFKEALSAFEKAYEHSYFQYGKDSKETAKILEMYAFSSLLVVQTKKTLILCGRLAPSPGMDFVQSVAYSRWNDMEKAMDFKERWESSSLDLEDVLYRAFDDSAVAKTVFERIRT